MIVADIVRVIRLCESKHMKTPDRIRMNPDLHDKMVEHLVETTTIKKTEDTGTKIAGVPIVPDQTIATYSIEYYGASF